jgi:hypothetical protein
MLVVLLDGADQGLLERLVAAQVLLRQRRPFVRQLGLVSNEHNRAVEALLAKGESSGRAGQAGADDDDRPRRRPIDQYP